MKLYLFCDNLQMLEDKLRNICNFIQPVIKTEFCIEGTSLENISVESLQHLADQYLIDKKIPLVGMFYTHQEIPNEPTILGVAYIRVAIIKWQGNDLTKMALVTLHELGHLCDAEDCNDKDCLMYSTYHPLPLINVTLKQLLCKSCFAIISHSWIYKLLTKEVKI